MSRGGVGVELNPCFETLRTESFCCSVVPPLPPIANQGEKEVAIGKCATCVLL